jgi:hypothetical protein
MGSCRDLEDLRLEAWGGLTARAYTPVRQACSQPEDAQDRDPTLCLLLELQPWG